MYTHDNNPEALMSAHGIRPTANRILILKTLLQAGRPLSLTEIETALESVDKSIISRTLTAFRRHHLLHAVSDGSSIRYEVCHCTEAEEDTDRHVHFHCERCGRTYCLEDLPVPPVSCPDGFRVESAEYVLHGICPACTGKR